MHHQEAARNLRARAALLDEQAARMGTAYAAAAARAVRGLLEGAAALEEQAAAKAAEEVSSLAA